MASDTTSKQEQPSNSQDVASVELQKLPSSSNSHDMVNVAMQLPPELLMAAKHGDWRMLEDIIMGREGATVPHQVIVDIGSEEAVEHYGSDLVLHAVASGGDSEDLLTTSTVIFGKAKHLLGARNARGDTPLHCAARAGNIRMVSHLIELARCEDDGTSRLQVALRKENKQGETVLHDAIRCANKEMVCLLMLADAELARFPRNGVSPLYLAILLGHDDIAEHLYEKDNHLSCSGPDGQNALHVAVLRSESKCLSFFSFYRVLLHEY
ncbi:hypothetical protein PVAP13_7KG105245 [Panicum virgatum]|uniref:Uncharacterized protein n=1 Tax=Panicum virgatum TaxID=38727 RepID=A0A8T0QAQ5_PANVG|nr:hypothetical protein PVAP13_7KG105245 [Panicum virgatum]